MVCGLLDGLDALGRAVRRGRAGRLVLVGGGARSAAYRQILADLSGRAVHVAAEAEHVAAGAAVQAAAVLHQRPAAETGGRVGTLAAGDEVEPGPGATAARDDVRAAYAARRDAGGLTVPSTVA